MKEKILLIISLGVKQAGPSGDPGQVLTLCTSLRRDRKIVGTMKENISEQ